MLGLIGTYQRGQVQAKGSNWRASAEWRESCPHEGCDYKRTTLENFIEHHSSHYEWAVGMQYVAKRN